MSEINTNLLLGLNLKYRSDAKPLKELAFADVGLKALFWSHEPLDIKELAKHISKMLGVKRISEDMVSNSLKFYIEKGKIHQSCNKLQLTKKTRKEIALQVATRDNELEGILTRHFPNNETIKGDIKAWFYESITSFFNYCSDDWIKNVCTKMERIKFARQKNLIDILSPSIKKYGLENIKENLTDSFLKFLSSKNLEDSRCLMSLGTAMFSAKLVTAHIGTDPIPINEIRNSTFILDTNVLIALSLEDKRIGDSIKALGEALKYIGADLIVIPPTKEEYDKVITLKKQEIIALIKKFPNDIVVNANDEFLHAAINKRGCSLAEADFEQFFFDIKEPVTSIDGLLINSINSYNIIIEIDKARKDTDLKKTLQNYRLSAGTHRRPKPEHSLEHDAALFYVQKSYKNKKAWILTLDRSLQTYATEAASQNSVGSVIMVDALIQILSLNELGPDFDANNFAPLLSNLLLNRCSPPTDIYTLEDLHWLNNINERIAELPAEDIKEAIGIIVKARLEGKNHNDNALQLEINRRFQQKIMDKDTQIEAAIERAKNAEQNIADGNKRNEALNAELNVLKFQEAKRKLIKGLVYDIILRSAAVSIVVYGIYFIATKIWINDKIDIWINLLFATPALLFFIINAVKKYKERVKKIII